MTKKKPRIVIEQKEEGIKVKIDFAYSRDHALFMMNQAITNLLLDTQMKEEDNELSQLSVTDKEEPKED